MYIYKFILYIIYIIYWYTFYIMLYLMWRRLQVSWALWTLTPRWLAVLQPSVSVRWPGKVWQILSRSLWQAEFIIVYHRLSSFSPLFIGCFACFIRCLLVSGICNISRDQPPSVLSVEGRQFWQQPEVNFLKCGVFDGFCMCFLFCAPWSSNHSSQESHGDREVEE